MQPDLPDLPDQVSFATVRDLPSTRAGGQDDVSSSKLPQISVDMFYDDKCIYIYSHIYFV